MRSLHISASLSRAAGGIFEIELALAKQLTQQAVGVSVLGLRDRDWADDSSRWDGISTAVFDTSGPRSFGYAAGLLGAMIKANSDIAHLHTLWMYPSVAIHRWARRTEKPYVVTPNGMLEPWALGNSAWKKKLAGFLYEDRMLRDASCLQANTEKELRDIRAYGLKNPVCIIPNGVDLVNAETLKAENRKGEKKTLLFLGRLHPKKGLPNSIRAWKQVLHSTSKIQNSKFHEWQFVVAGWDQGGHKAELKRLCDELGLKWVDVSAAEFVGDSLSGQNHSSPLGKTAAVIDAPLQSYFFQSTINNQQSTIVNLPSVIFTGPAFGATKDALLRQASAFILPSYSEGLPMSVLEAWSYGLPVLMTDFCNLPEGFAADAAIRIGTDTASIAEGLRELISLPETHNGPLTTSLSSLGANGRQLLSERFTWPQVAAQIKEVYEWVLGGGQKPCSVVL